MFPHRFCSLAKINIPFNFHHKSKPIRFCHFQLVKIHPAYVQPEMWTMSRAWIPSTPRGKPCWPLWLCKYSLDSLPHTDPDGSNLEQADSRGASCCRDALRNLISHKTPQGWWWKRSGESSKEVLHHVLAAPSLWLLERKAGLRSPLCSLRRGHRHCRSHAQFFFMLLPLWKQEEKTF